MFVFLRGGHKVKYTTEVILCTYNGRRFLEEQIRSILDQTVPVDRIRIYDDQSSDGTVEFLNEVISSLYINDAEKIKISINDSNLGYARNFCRGIMNAAEDIIFLCDQDDVWEPDKVEVLLSLFEKFEPDMVFSDGALIDQFGRAMKGPSVLRCYGLRDDQVSSFHANAFERLLKRNYINGAASAIRRTAAQRALPLPCDMPHDFWLAIWCSLHKGVVATPRKLYRYRQHGNNVIGAGGSNLLYHWLGIWRQPILPRERDLHIWKAVTGRLDSTETGSPDKIAAARDKLDWLTRVVSRERGGLRGTVALLKSALAGHYGRYATATAFARDLVASFRYGAAERRPRQSDI